MDEQEVTHVCAGVRVRLPPGLPLEEVSREERSLLNIPGARVRGIRWRWSGPAGVRLHLQHWDGHPPHPGEPISIERKWTVESAAGVVRAARCRLPGSTTSGPVLHAWMKREDGHYHFTARGLAEEVFEGILGSMA